MPKNLFTYGSLMYSPVWEKIVRDSGAETYANQLGRIDGYSRHAVMGETYPGVIPAPGGSVRGRVYFNLSSADLARLDNFEGPDYERIEVSVVLDAGKTGQAESVVQAGLYLYRHQDRLTPQDWSTDWFEREGMAKFLATYVAHYSSSRGVE
jgi:gamma-glutamylcyclotransferase (GGCT)/AIG2-like uncharacterized protein YtfP